MTDEGNLVSDINITQYYISIPITLDEHTERLIQGIGTVKSLFSRGTLFLERLSRC